MALDPTPHAPGRKLLRVTPELLAQFCKDGTGMVEVIANPLPADARIVASRMSDDGRDILFVVESASYPDSTGLPYEEVLSPTFRRSIS